MNKLKAFFRPKIILLLIVVLAGFLRFNNLSNIPVSVYWDGAASGYNAYSIAQTGKDEYGYQFPLLFRSFNDYKASGNIYLTVIPVKIFGLNELSERFTSAFFGTLTVWLTYFLTITLLELCKAEQIALFKRKITLKPDTIALLASLFLAISPWHLQFSRAEYEANVALFFVVLGIWLLLRSLYRLSSSTLFLSCIVLALSFYFYRSVFIFLPLFLICLLIIFYRKLFKTFSISQIAIAFVLFWLILGPFLPVMLSKNGLIRAEQVNVFSNSSNEVLQSIKAQEKSGNTLVAKVINNRRIVYAKVIIGGYFSHFGFNYLFVNGDANSRHSTGFVGEFYWWELPFLILGFLVIFRFSKRLFFILAAWILIAPLPAAFSVPTPHALRSLNMLPAPQIIVSFGVYSVYLLLRRSYRFGYVLILSLVIIVLFARYLYFYYEVWPDASSPNWADGYKQLTQYVFTHEKGYEKVVISGHYWQPYIYFLFYKKYPPALYQKYGSKRGFANYVFGGTSWDGAGLTQELGNIDIRQFAHAHHILVALSPQEWDQQTQKPHKLTEIKNHLNQVVFIVVDYN